MCQLDGIMTHQNDINTDATNLAAYLMAGPARDASKSRRKSTDISTMLLQLDRVDQVEDYLDRTRLHAPIAVNSIGEVITPEQLLDRLMEVPDRYHDGKRWRRVNVPYHQGVVGFYPPDSNTIKFAGSGILRGLFLALSRAYRQNTGNRHLATVVHADAGEAVHMHIVGTAYHTPTVYNPVGNKLPTLPDATLSTIRMLYHRAISADRCHGAQMILQDKMDDDNKRPWNLELAWMIDLWMRQMLMADWDLKSRYIEENKNHKKWVKKCLLSSESYYRLENAALRQKLSGKIRGNITEILEKSIPQKIDPIDRTLEDYITEQRHQAQIQPCV